MISGDILFDTSLSLLFLMYFIIIFNFGLIYILYYHEIPANAGNHTKEFNGLKTLTDDMISLKSLIYNGTNTIRPKLPGINLTRGLFIILGIIIPIKGLVDSCELIHNAAVHGSATAAIKIKLKREIQQLNTATEDFNKMIQEVENIRIHINQKEI